jgi:hypothetical protein
MLNNEPQRQSIVHTSDTSAGRSRTHNLKDIDSRSTTLRPLHMVHPAKTATEIQVVSEGDLILEVSDPWEKMRFTVASQVLCIASPIMRAMLGPKSRFRERKDFMQHDPGNGGNLFVLELPEEVSVEAFGIILNAIHLQYDKIPLEVDFDLLVQLAVVCGKYDMAKSVSTLVDGWVLRSESLAVELWGDERYLRRVPPWTEYADWLFVAWLFGSESTFYKISRDLKLKTRGTDPDDWKKFFLEDSMGGKRRLFHIPDVVIG